MVDDDEVVEVEVEMEGWWDEESEEGDLIRSSSACR